MANLRVQHYLNSIAENISIENQSGHVTSLHSKSQNSLNKSQSRNSNSYNNQSCPSIHCHVKTPKKNVTPCNPFAVVEPSSFSMPSFSPSVFIAQEDSEADKSFSWNIETLASLNPVEIDESSIQHNLEELDEHQEQKVQQAIESFFLQNSVAPSPWGGSLKHVTFSPHLTDTKCFNDTNSTTNSVSEVCKKEAWTQTVLSIPMEVDLEKILGQYFTFNEDQQRQPAELLVECDTLEEQNLLSTSSLRRKLFMCSPNSDKNGNTPQKSPSSQFVTPEKMDRKPVLNSGQLFSSSPISLQSFSVSPCGHIEPLNNTLISPIKRRSSSIRYRRPGNSEERDSFTYLKSILKSSSDCIEEVSERDISMKNDLENQSFNLKLGNNSQMSLSMKTEYHNSMIDVENHERVENSIGAVVNFNKMVEDNNISYENIDTAKGIIVENSDMKTDLDCLQISMMNSEDTGYQTASNPGYSAMDISVFCSNENDKPISESCNISSINCSEFFQQNLNMELKCSRKKSILFDSAMLESNSKTDDGFQQRLTSISERNPDELFIQESILRISHCDWIPKICSTPHN